MGYAASQIGVMQGRLVPPEDDRVQCFPARRWRDEFPRAAALGIASIEWVYERFGADVNPIGSAEAWAEVRALERRWQVAVASICADILMDHPLVRVPVAQADVAAERLQWLLERAAEAGVTRLVLPFVGANALHTPDELHRARSYLVTWAAVAEARGLAIHLETSLGPRALGDWLASIPSRAVGVTYDIGNSLIFGHQAREELDAYGDRITSVHVKDATRNGVSVPLGTGDADFGYCFDRLSRLGFAGPFVLQGARIAGEDEVATVARYLTFLRGFFAAAPPRPVDGSGTGR